jgi:hypothetical protein
VSLLLEGVAEGGVDPATVPVFESEPAALAAELAASRGEARVVVLFCHEARDEVFALLAALGADPIDAGDDLTSRPAGSGPRP